MTTYSTQTQYKAVDQGRKADIIHIKKQAKAYKRELKTLIRLILKQVAKGNKCIIIYRKDLPYPMTSMSISQNEDIRGLFNNVIVETRGYGGHNRNVRWELTSANF